MKKALKWLGIVLAGLVGLLAVAVVVLYFLGTNRLNKTYDIQAEAIAIPNDEATLARGQHLVEGGALCTICHGQDLSGDVEFEDPMVGSVYSSNITGLDATFSDADFVRAIRHGVDPDGKPLILMPSHLYIDLSAEDLGATVAYLKTIPRVENNLPESHVNTIGRVMLAAGMFGDEVLTVETIDHNQPFPSMPEIGANAAYGEYLSFLCTNCHGENLAGQIVDPTEPNSPWAPNLTPSGELGDWSEADFIQAMRTGVSPHGHVMDSEFMPWKAFAKFDDAELQGLWMYLQSVPAVSSEGQPEE